MCINCGSPKVYCKDLCATCYHRQYREVNKERLAIQKHENYIDRCSICPRCGNRTGRPEADYCRTCYHALRAEKAATQESRDHVASVKKAVNRRWYLRNTDRWPSYSENRRARLLQADEGLTAELWRTLLDLYEHQCAYCLQEFTELEQDHVLPLSKGGKHSVTNVVPACKPCNRAKAASFREVNHTMYYIMLDISQEGLL